MTAAVVAALREPMVDAGPVRAALARAAARGCSLRRAAAITEVPVRQLQAARWRPQVAAGLAAAVLAADEDGLLIGLRDQPVDEVLLEQILAGQRPEIPWGTKGAYARELYARGWTRTKVAHALRASFGTADRWAQEAL